MKIGIDAKWFFNGNPSGRVVIYNLIKNIAILNLPHEFYIILWEEDKQRDFPIKSPNFKFIYLRKMPNLFANLLSPYFLNTINIDICIFQYFSPICSSFKRVTYIHDIIFQSNPSLFTHKELLYFKPMKFLARRSDGIITISNTERRRIEKFQYLGKNSKIDVIYNGVSNRFKPLEFIDGQRQELIREKYQLPSEYILYLGRLNQRKNIDKLLQAFALIDNKRIMLVLAGKYDWKMFNLPMLIEKLCLGNRVITIGFVDDNDIDAVYSMASLFCYLSTDEGFGLPPLEAMASGVPILVSNTEVMNEIFFDCAKFVDPTNINEIVHAINNILQNKAEVNQFIKKGLMRAKQFQWEKSVTKLISFIESL